MNSFDMYDRYDFAMSLLMGVLMVGALALGAPLWVAVVIIFVTCLASFIHHFDEIMWPSDDAGAGPMQHPPTSQR